MGWRFLISSSAPQSGHCTISPDIGFAPTPTVAPHSGHVDAMVGTPSQRQGGSLMRTLQAGADQGERSRSSTRATPGSDAYGIASPRSTCTTTARPRNSACGQTSRGGALATCTRSEEHTSELQSQSNLACRLLLEKQKHI